MSTHTPTPWTYHKHGNRDWIEDANTDIVVEAVGHLDGPFICEAVNNHDRLTAEVGRLTERLSDAEVVIDRLDRLYAPLEALREYREKHPVPFMQAINPEEPK